MKKSLVIAFALMLVFAFATSAMAAQLANYNHETYGGENTKVFAPTPKKDSTVSAAYVYPYGIYLPNQGSPTSYRIHSNYATNTDSCASCHSTHTAVGQSLLQWYTVYETCMACHDGTIASIYNVKGGAIGSVNTGKPLPGGMFDVTGGSDSNHNVRGALSNAAAPGGSVVPDVVSVGSDTKTRWASEFGCQSCHSPHGQGGNARILSPDANGAAAAAAELVSGTYTANVNGYVYNGSAQVYILKGYPYTPKIYVNSVLVSTYKIDNTSGNSQIKTAAGAAINFTGKTVEVRSAVAGMRVTMTIGNYMNPLTETVDHVSGMNGFCGTCHTDYNTEAIAAGQYGDALGSAKQLNGTYSQAHRHQVGNEVQTGFGDLVVAAKMVTESGKLECLTCHVAHGVAANYWSRTIGAYNASTAPFANGYMVSGLSELSGSSALKRIPNMGTCEACHQKGSAAEGHGLVAPTASVIAAAPNYNSANIASIFGGVNDATSILLPNNANAALDSDVEPAKTQKAIARGQNRSLYFTPSATGLFNPDIAYVGSEKCGECHTEAFIGWEASHGESFQTAAQADIAGKLAATYAIATTTPVGTVIGDETLGSPAVHYEFFIKAAGKIGMRLFNNGAEKYSYDVIRNGSDYLLSTSNGVYLNVSQTAQYLFMNDYILAGRGAGTTDLDATGTQGTAVAAATYQYLRFAQWEPGLGIVIPYLSRSTGNPTTPSGVQWYNTTSNTADGCLSCHAPQLEYKYAYDAALAANDKLPPNEVDITIGCETCHGPGLQHASAPTRKNILNVYNAGMTATQGGNACLECHSGGHNQVAVPALSSGKNTNRHYGTSAISNYFKGNGSSTRVGCTTCHDIHNNATAAEGFTVRPANNLCGGYGMGSAGTSCHGAVGAINIEAYFNNPTNGGAYLSGSNNVLRNHNFYNLVED